MVILITGAKGQLGSELNNILQRGSSELGKLPPVYAGCEVLAVDVDELDITSADAVDSFFSRHKPDLVFNCAAMTNVDGCESDEETAYRINALGPRNLAVACQKHGSRLLHVSTDYVFRGGMGRDHTPSMTHPVPIPPTGGPSLQGRRRCSTHVGAAASAAPPGSMGMWEQLRQDNASPGQGERQAEGGRGPGGKPHQCR